MWLYIPREYCPSSPESLDSISEFGLFFQNLELCVSLSGKATQRPYSWRGWKTRPWMKLLSGVTLQPSTAAAGMELWIQSVLASRASQSQSQENVKESRKGHDQDSSLKPAELFAKYDQGIFLSKTCQDSFLTSSCQSYSANFPKWGSMRSGECFQQEMWVAPILEKGSLFWRTPHASDPIGGVMEIRPECNGHYKLRDQSASWPTPRMNDFKGHVTDATTRKDGKCRNDQLQNAAIHTGPMAPAKQSNGSDSSKSAQTSPQPLKNWETPKVQMGEDCPSERRRNSPNLKSQTAQMATGKKRLNPNFVEHLMGIPTGWSLPIPIDQNDYKRWETESCHLLRLLHSACYGNELNNTKGAK